MHIWSPRGSAFAWHTRKSQNKISKSIKTRNIKMHTVTTPLIT